MQNKLRIGLMNYMDAVYAPIRDITQSNKEAYCDRHGYTYILDDEAIDSSRPASWNKVKMFQKYIGDYDWLFWNDADTFITNPGVTLESILDQRFPIMVGSDDAGINCGNILVQNTPDIATVLQRWWDQDADVNHFFWEQKALVDLVQSDPWWAANVKVLDHKVINAYPVNYEPGDFLVHFAGYGRNPVALAQMMREWYKEHSI